ncbi:MAG: tripartite tricarboxylate transporter substrate binding protein [Rubrivivax sp.]|nr:tripartite tricarboxylate transporter substrate binding protein [Rubrivivax sp.]
MKTMNAQCHGDPPDRLRRALLRRALLLAAGAGGAVHDGLGWAQTPAPSPAAFPSRPLRLVVPFPPGGSTDLLARRIGDKLAASLGQPVLVDNRPGAGGATGSVEVARAPADGHTLLFGVTGTHAISPAINPKIGYDPRADFAALSIVVSAPLVVVVRAESPHKSLADLIAWAKANPERLTHGSPGNGTTMHLTGEMFALATGTRLTHVPYKGSAPATQDLLGGQIESMFGDLLVVLPLVASGRLRALAVTSRQRHPLLAAVPTVAEAGPRELADFEASSWQGLFVPAGVPGAVQERLNAEVGRAVRAADLKDFFAERGFVVEARSLEESRRFLEGEVAKWTRLVRTVNPQVN